MENLQDPRVKIALALGATTLSVYGAKKYFAGGVNKYSPDLTGQVTVVTGGTDGIGLEVVKVFAKLGAKVILVGRSEEKARKIIDSLPEGQIAIFKRCDFADLENVKKLGEELLQEEEKIDILVNNAGLNSPEFKKSAQNIEFTIAVNHLAPVYLTSLLLPLLKKSEKGRIINVSSTAHKRAVMDFDEILLRDSPEGYDWVITYGNTKMATIYFTRKLANYLFEKNITNVKTVTLHPGVVLSGFSLPLQDKYLWFKIFMKLAYPLLLIGMKSNSEGS